MGLPLVGCTSWSLRFIGQVKLFWWAGPSFTMNWAKSLFNPTLVRAPPPDPPQQRFYINDVLMCKNTPYTPIQKNIYYLYNSSLLGPSALIIL